MNDLEDIVRSLLHDAVAPLQPAADLDNVRKRDERRRRRNRLTVAAAAGVLVVAAVGALGWLNASRHTPLTASASGQVCAIPTALPFRPEGLDASQWSINPYNPAQGLAVWSGLDPPGIIEVWNGGRGELPEPVTNIETVTVLGQPAVIGDISDGYSVIVQLGPTVCDRWALVAHPGTTRDQLHDIATDLQTS